MAVTPTGKGETENLGTGPSDLTAIGSDATTQPALPATRPSDALMVPIVVPNSFW